jgi:hypothetical protein
MAKLTFTDPRSQRKIKEILAVLATDRMGSKKLAARVNLSQSSVQNYLMFLREEPRRVRICGYEEGLGPTAPLYGLGSAPDAARPPKRTPSDRFQALKANPEAYQKSLALRRHGKLREKLAKQPQSWLSALL